MRRGFHDSGFVLRDDGPRQCSARILRAGSGGILPPVATVSRMLAEPAAKDGCATRIRFRTRRNTRATSSAFTLIEVVISSSLMAMIVVSAYLCFGASIAGRKTMEPRLEVIQNARVAMALMSADLRAACPLDKNSEFIGMSRMLGEAEADNLDFGTHNYTPRKAGEGDFCQLSYYLDQDAESGNLSLWRRRNPAIAPDPFSGGNKEEIAAGLLGLRFEYFDGLDWYDTWGDETGKAATSQRQQSNLAGMPDAVRVTLWFDSNPRKAVEDSQVDEKREAPMVFQTIIQLNLAAASQSGSTNAGSTGSGSDAAGQTPPNAPNTIGGQNP
jgi:type II secretory pathway component PulJ